jgi:hypothetical protein
LPKSIERLDEMHLVISGSRNIADVVVIEHLISEALKELTAYHQNLGEIEVYVGDAKGVDAAVRRQERISQTPLHGKIMHTYTPEWKRYRAAAGPMRNEKMLRDAKAAGDVDGTGSCLVAIWDGESAGTHHASTFARKLGMTQIVYVIKATVAGHIEAEQTVLVGNKTLWSTCIALPYTMPLIRDPNE